MHELMKHETSEHDEIKPSPRPRVSYSGMKLEIPECLAITDTLRQDLCICRSIAAACRYGGKDDSIDYHARLSTYVIETPEGRAIAGP